MILYFIRHGQTDWNMQGRIQGSCDVHLNEIGIKQAEELSHKFIQDGCVFSRIYSSTQSRALETAKALSRSTKVQCISVKGLEEMNLGDWEGLSWEKVIENYPKEYEKWFLDRRYTKTPKGESYQDMLIRVLSAIHKIINENNENVVIVTHSAVIMCIQCYLTDTPFEKMTKFKVENTSIIQINSSLFSDKKL